jgi:hypothetical protein
LLLLLDDVTCVPADCLREVKVVGSDRPIPVGGARQRDTCRANSPSHDRQGDREEAIIAARSAPAMKLKKLTVSTWI